jgi:hypothetical protein
MPVNSQNSEQIVQIQSKISFFSGLAKIAGIADGESITVE